MNMIQNEHFHCAPNEKRSFKLPPILLIVVLGLALSACGTITHPAVRAAPAAAIPPTLTPAPSATASSTATSLEPTATVAPTITPTSTPGIGSARVAEIDGMEQVYVPAGDFLLGAAASDKDAKLSVSGGRAYPELPEQTVYLDSFWMDKYEVTNRQYKLCVEAGGCKRPYVDYLEKRLHYYDSEEYANFPVVDVNWFMAGQYCAWAGRRLPSEAEWEKAARGTDGRIYPWGNDPVSGDKANFCDTNCSSRPHHNNLFDDGWDTTSPVGSYPAGASPYGALDMAGNVWEWTSTIIRDYPYDPKDGREDLSAPGERVWRGGPWSNGIWWMRSSLRYRSIPTYWNVNLGFRCAVSK